MTNNTPTIASIISNKISNKIVALDDLNATERTIYEIDQLQMEVNSGMSFEQYFIWANVNSIKRIRNDLLNVGLENIHKLTDEAIKLAFPHGLDITDSEKSEMIYDLKMSTRNKLGSLGKKLEKLNGEIDRSLQIYYNNNFKK